MPRSLAHLSFPVERTRGRHYPEPPHPYRNAFQRDRDRVIHARAFRRLEGKTQVFTAPESDHFRNRLTHTLEVTQIARTVAGALDLNEDLVEALALVHDVGHPPFGHGGEAVLDRELRKFGERFDHNLHALRIVEQFEQRYAGFPGLNLSFEVREGIIKHSRDYDSAKFPDLAEYMLDQRPPLEAQLIDAADEAAYNSADLDDALDAGLVDAWTARGEVELFDRVMSAGEREYPGATRRQLLKEGVRRLLDALVSGLVEGVSQAVEEAGVRSVEGVRGHPRRLARFGPDAAGGILQLRKMLSQRVYNSPELVAERGAATERVAALFQYFMERPDELPADYREDARSEPIHRMVCDYIAGMTDAYLVRRVRELLPDRS